MKFLLIFSIVILNQHILVRTLRCQTQDSANDERFQKIYRVCFRRLESPDDDDYDDDNDSSDDYNNSSEDQRKYLNNITKNGQHQLHRSKRQNHDQHQHKDISNWNYNNQRNQKGTDDRSCLFHCIFHEMKITNRREFPDKHKMLHTLLKNVRERELQTFITDSIRECFRVIEINQVKDKCEFSKNLATCLTDRGQANCDDWNNGEVLV